MMGIAGGILLAAAVVGVIWFGVFAIGESRKAQGSAGLAWFITLIGIAAAAVLVLHSIV